MKLLFALLSFVFWSYNIDAQTIIANPGKLDSIKKKTAVSKVEERINHLMKSFTSNYETKSYHAVKSIEEYIKWSNDLDKISQEMLIIIDSNKVNSTQNDFSRIKAIAINKVETLRLNKFTRMIGGSSRLDVDSNVLNHLFDTACNKSQAKWLRTYPDDVNQTSYLYGFVRLSIYRQNNFDPVKIDSLNEDAHRKVLYYKLGNSIFNGEARENFLVRLLTRSGIKEHFYDREFEDLLKEYYQTVKSEKHKTQVKLYEKKIRGMTTAFLGTKAPPLNAVDIYGKRHFDSDFKNKLVAVTFLSPDAGNRAFELSFLAELQKPFKNDTNIVFLTIVPDTGGLGLDLVNYFNIQKYPSHFLIDGQWRLAFNPYYYEREKDPKKKLQEVISNQLAKQYDGPYVFHEDGAITAYNIHLSNLVKNSYQVKNNIQLTAQTDDSRVRFKVQLKRSLQVEASTYDKPKKLFVLSDIEGNFDAFRKLLQASNIINEDFNWIFGDGHLVFAGDMFDRGAQVTECLWLVYTLEEKAKEAGGYVHFILGNHEIMNLQNDHRYVEAKYKDNVALMGKTLVQLYNENSELGRWLRTKNIIEKIGDLLFTHGGVSVELNKLKLSVTEINSLARPNYANNQIDYGNLNINTVMSNKIGPFWFRGYYDQKSKVSETSVDSILFSFDVRHIVTGHTIVADTISAHYGGKVINTDTKHAFGENEALLIEGDEFYRVDDKGYRILLFVNNRKK